MASIIHDPLKPLEVILFQLFTIVFKHYKQYGYYYSRSTETSRSNIASIIQDYFKALETIWLLLLKIYWNH